MRALTMSAAVIGLPPALNNTASNWLTCSGARLSFCARNLRALSMFSTEPVKAAIASSAARVRVALASSPSTMCVFEAHCASDEAV